MDEEDGILNLAGIEADVDEEDEGLTVNQSYDDGMNMQEDADVDVELDNVEIPVEHESSGVLVHENTDNAGTDEVHKEENTEKDFQAVETPFSTHDVEDVKTDGTDVKEHSPISRIHFEILELTRKISMPEAGILNLIRATEEAENEAKRQQEAGIVASSSKESLLLRAMAGHGSADFSIQGSFRGLSPRDLKQISASPYVSKTQATTRKATLQSDEGGKAPVGDKESLSTSPEKDRTVTMNSQIGAPGDASVKPQTAEELPQTAGNGTETRKSEVTDRDTLGLFKLMIELPVDRYLSGTVHVQLLVHYLLHQGYFPFDQKFQF